MCLVLQHRVKQFFLTMRPLWCTQDYFILFIEYWYLSKQMYSNSTLILFSLFFFLSDMTLLIVCVLFSLSPSCTHSVTYRETSMQSVLNLPIKCNCFTMILSAHGSEIIRMRKCCSQWNNTFITSAFTTLGCWHDACTLHTQLRSLNVHTSFWMEILLKAVAFSLC